MRQCDGTAVINGTGTAQYAASRHRRILKRHGFFGSMSRRGNPYDNAQAENVMKTLKVEAVYTPEYETFDDVATLPDCIPRSVI